MSDQRAMDSGFNFYKIEYIVFKGSYKEDGVKWVYVDKFYDQTQAIKIAGAYIDNEFTYIKIVPIELPYN